MPLTAEERQVAYYERTAAAYDAMHNSVEDHEHNFALEFINAISSTFQLKSFLDVGAGTGRGVKFLTAHGKEARGVEPVKALIEKGELNGLPKGLVEVGDGMNLPFADNSFDAVLECGILHHVAEPAKVVAEMMRVARKAVFLADSNRFGQGSNIATRLLKLVLYKTNLWNATQFLQTKGKNYKYSEGDGIYYSYSIYDSYFQLANWADKIWLVPTSRTSNKESSWLHPLVTSSHALLCAVKTTEEEEPGF